MTMSLVLLEPLSTQNSMDMSEKLIEERLIKIFLEEK